ncbi:MAG: hypothetical protein ACREGC_02795 [Minisyncoccia bacterium]
MNTIDIALKAKAKVGTTYKLAKIIGVRWETAKKWTTGKSKPNGEHLLKLIDLAGKGSVIFTLPALLSHSLHCILCKISQFIKVSSIVTETYA